MTGGTPAGGTKQATDAKPATGSGLVILAALAALLSS